MLVFLLIQEHRKLGNMRETLIKGVVFSIFVRNGGVQKNPVFADSYTESKSITKSISNRSPA